jgi:hypothetical protein
VADSLRVKVNSLPIDSSVSNYLMLVYARTPKNLS